MRPTDCSPSLLEVKSYSKIPRKQANKPHESHGATAKSIRRSRMLDYSSGMHPRNQFEFARIHLLLLQPPLSSYCTTSEARMRT